jgi:hypothetical protein
MRFTLGEMHACEMQAYEMQACEMQAYEMQACACDMHVYP